MKRLLLSLLVSSFMLAASAQVPKTLSFQGYLIDQTTGDPLTASPDMTFSLWDALTGGAQKWSEIHSAVPVSKGLYNVLLGDAGTPVDLPFDQVYYLQVKVGLETLSPRITVSSSAYSLSSVNASNITTGTLNGSLVGTGLNATNITTGLIANTLLDPDLQDLADGSLSGSVIGSGISATNITTGTLSGGLIGNGINASNLSSGTIPDARLETTVDINSLNVGNAAQFALSSTGNITKLNNVGYSFPSAQGAANSFLTNGGTGTLSWATSLAGSQVGPGISASNITTGTLSGSLVGSGVPATNITGTLPGTQVGTGISASNISSGSLSGSLVGTGVSATNVTSGTLADGQLETTIDRTGFNATGNVTAGGFMTSVGGVHVGSASVPASGNLEVEGYARLGSGAPVIQMKKITGTTDPTQGNEVVLSHGLTVSKIISVTAMVESSAGVTFIPSGFTFAGGFEFYVYLSGANIRIATVAANSANVVNKPFKILITYEQ